MADEIDYAEIEGRLANTMVACGPAMFDLLAGLDLAARYVAVDVIKRKFSMPAVVAFEMLLDPLGMKKSIDSDPMLSLIFKAIAYQRREYVTPEAGERLAADMNMLRDHNKAVDENEGPEV